MYSFKWLKDIKTFIQDMKIQYVKIKHNLKLGGRTKELK